MTDIGKISDSLTETIKDSNFQDSIFELSEVGLDSFISDEILKDIPVFGTIVKIYKSIFSIQDKLFLKKLLVFLINLKSTSSEARLNQIEKIENDPKYRTKVGEKLLFIIDKCEDAEKSDLIGKLFKGFIEDKINYDDFLLASRAVENTPINTLNRFIAEKWDNFSLEEGGELISFGLMNASYLKPSLRYNEIEDGEINCYTTHIGEKIQELLNFNLT